MHRFVTDTATATRCRRRGRATTSSGFMTTLPTELNRLIVMFAGLPCHATVNKAMHTTVRHLQLWLSSHYFFALRLSRREWRPIVRLFSGGDGDIMGRMFLRQLRKFRLTRSHYLFAEDSDLPLAPGDGNEDDVDDFLRNHTLTFMQDTTLSHRVHEFLMRNFLGTFHECVAKTVVLGVHYVLVLDDQNRWMTCNRVPPMHRVTADVSTAEVPANANDGHFDACRHITDVLEALLHFLGWGPIDAIGNDPIFIVTYRDRSTTVETVRLVC